MALINYEVSDAEYFIAFIIELQTCIIVRMNWARCKSSPLSLNPKIAPELSKFISQSEFLRTTQLSITELQARRYASDVFRWPTIVHFILGNIPPCDMVHVDPKKCQCIPQMTMYFWHQVGRAHPFN